MLSEKSRPVIEATLPVVGENIREITERFHDHLFGEHPGLLDGLFNRGNQAEGTQQQALAGSVAMFASTLVAHPDRLPEHLLSRIAHKHASLGAEPGPVSGGLRQPDVGDRRHPGRRRHARGGGYVDRGLLDHGLGPDQPGVRAGEVSNLLHDSVDAGDVLTLSLPFGDVVHDDSGRPLVYLCGPLPFMQGVRTALLDRGISPADIQYEVFGPDLWQADAD
jgi:hypothetical protein